MKKIRKEFKKEKKFIISFFIISSVLYILVSTLCSKDVPVIGTWSVTSVCNGILNILGIRTIIIDRDTIYFANGISFNIILECTGVYEMIILSAAILSYPTNIKNKFYGIIIGTVIIYILNMLRLVSISYIIIYHTDKFNFVDRYLWQISLVVFISVTYMIWLRLISKQTGRSGSLS